jgi:hypothetical protein
MNVKVFRPHIDDVERLSFGKGAKKQRGTGSRSVCHRLNQDERKLYDLAKQAGYLTVRGTGYRKERKGSPLCNIYRQRCDAQEELCVIVKKNTVEDTVVIDFSTLRVGNDEAFVQSILVNVFQAKYPDLYWSVVKQNQADADIYASNDHRIVRRTLSKTSVVFPIDWDAVRTKPIWGVNERLITVTCDRDVAKALALDVLKESHNFDLSVATDSTNESQSFDDQKMIIEKAEIAPQKDMDSVNGDSDCDSSIDWDDI